MPPQHIATRAGSGFKELPQPGANKIYVQLYSTEGRHVADFQMDEYKYLTTPPVILRQGQNRYWCWNPRYSQYREGQCPNIDVIPQTLPEGDIEPIPDEPAVAIPAAAPDKPETGFTVNIGLYTWDGVSMGRTPMLESVWFNNPPVMIFKGADYFCFHPRFSQYRRCECMNIEIIAVQPTPPNSPQTAVPPVNAR